MCYYGKEKYVSAIACLRRALYLDPFQWRVSYDLGVVHLCTEQYASAFHHLTCCINLSPDLGRAFTYLGLALSRLGDLDNSSKAYERGLELHEEPLGLVVGDATLVYTPLRTTP
jgi:Bardet-Biedl syndrome 4 protein